MDEAERKKKSDMLEVEKRIYQIGLMLRRKPVSFIIQYCADTWKIEARQARNYIRKAKADWKEYFEKLKGDGMAYHIAQMRDLKDIAFGEKDTRLVLDITKEEAKLMGIYPSEKHDVKVEGEIKVTDAKRKLTSKIASLASRAGEDKILK